MKKVDERPAAARATTEIRLAAALLSEFADVRTLEERIRQVLQQQGALKSSQSVDEQENYIAGMIAAAVNSPSALSLLAPDSIQLDEKQQHIADLLAPLPDTLADNNRPRQMAEKQFEDLIPRIQRIRRNPADYARLRAILDELDPRGAKSGSAPTNLPKHAPERWVDRPDKTEDFEVWLDRVWGNYIDAGLLTQAALGKLDESARYRLHEYAHSKGVDAATLVPPAFRHGDGQKAIDALRRGDEQEARRHVSSSYVRRLKRQLAQEKAKP